MVQPDYLLVDADQHYYEEDDCFSRFIEPKFRDKALRIVREPGGPGVAFLGEQPMTFMPVIPTDNMFPPGCLKQLFAAAHGDDAGDSGGISDFALSMNPLDRATVPEYIADRTARLALMDKQGVEAAIMLPTLAVTVEHELCDDPKVAAANLHAFNRWLEETWGYGDDGRIFSTALISLADLDLAIAELDRVLAAGARLINLRPGPVYGRSPADPYFDPFWARVQDAGASVTLHSGNSGYFELVAKHWGEAERPSVYEMSAFSQFLGFVERPIVDTLAAMVLHNLFARFPGVRVLSIESGAAWASDLVRQLSHVWTLGGQSPANLGGAITEPPAETFKRHVYVSPFVEDDVDALVAAVGADRVVFGSDYPHPEGATEPVEFVDKLGALDPVDQRKVMRGNLGALLGLEA